MMFNHTVASCKIWFEMTCIIILPLAVPDKVKNVEVETRYTPTTSGVRLIMVDFTIEVSET